jgi:hypothetical protein
MTDSAHIFGLLFNNSFLFAVFGFRFSVFGFQFSVFGKKINDILPVAKLLEGPGP